MRVIQKLNQHFQPLKDVDLTYHQWRDIHNDLNGKTGDEAHQYLNQNPHVWLQYHKLYEQLRKNWPVIPWQVAAEKLLDLLPPLQGPYVVADCGCGKGDLGRAFRDRNFPYKVKNFHPLHRFFVPSLTFLV